MNKHDFLKLYKSYDKIEDMPEKELSKIIKGAMDTKLSDIKPIPYKGKYEVLVKYSYPELTANCPMTQIQDLYTVTIEFIPDKYIPELKSLKYYFLDYIGLPISHEHISAKIYKDFKLAVKPKQLKVHLDVSIRGGIKTDCYLN